MTAATRSAFVRIIDGRTGARLTRTTEPCQPDTAKLTPTPAAHAVGAAPDSRFAPTHASTPRPTPEPTSITVPLVSSLFASHAQCSALIKIIYFNFNGRHPLGSVAQGPVASPWNAPGGRDTPMLSLRRHPLAQLPLLDEPYRLYDPMLSKAQELWVYGGGSATCSSLCVKRLPIKRNWGYNANLTRRPLEARVRVHSPAGTLRTGRTRHKFNCRC